jgi:hypothetical protein
MNMLNSTSKYSNAVLVEKAHLLKEIHNSKRNIAIWQRSVVHLNDGITTTQARLTEPVRASGTGNEILTHVENCLLADIEPTGIIRNDIAFLLTMFQYLTGSSTFRLLLAPVNTNMCRKFHTDINDLRLLCTYYGPGTLWLPDEFVNRKSLDTCDDGACIALDESKIQQAQAGEVVILKGAIYPQENFYACVHRSPTIEEAGQKRLLLRIDTNDFLTAFN